MGREGLVLAHAIVLSRRGRVAQHHVVIVFHLGRREQLRAIGRGGVRERKDRDDGDRDDGDRDDCVEKRSTSH